MQISLEQVLIIFLVTIFVVGMLRRFDISSILAFMVAGILIGPEVLGIIPEVNQSIKYVGEFGVVFLLFIVGIELSLDRLKQMRVQVFGFGGLQFITCASVLGGIVYLITNDAKIAFVAGSAFALSSTPVVLQLLNDSGESATQHGRLSLANLILQDLAFVPLLIIIPLLANQDSGLFQSVSIAILQAFLILAAIVVIGKKLLTPMLKFVAQIDNQELFLVTAMLITMGAAWITESSGLSLALGAFVAGLLVAETEYRTQIETDIRPIKGVLMGLFFIVVGMEFDLGYIKKNIFDVLVLTAMVLVIKTILISLLARAFRFSSSCSIKTGSLLSQVSEFGFVLFALAHDQTILPDEYYEIFTAVIVLSMAVTPLFLKVSQGLARRFFLKNPVHFDEKDIHTEVCDLDQHIIVVGYDLVGKTTCDLLLYKGLKFVVLDDDPRNVHLGRKQGVPIFFGKCHMLENLEKIGLERASMIAIMLADTKETNELATKLKEKYPEYNIVARAKDRKHATELREIGVNFVIPEAFESSLMMGNFILMNAGISEPEIRDAIEQFRAKEHPDSQISGIMYNTK